MGHKYLEEIVDLKKTTYNNYSDTGRDEKWKEQREVYSFDEREVWNLDCTFFYWLYERLMMYREKACVDLNFHTFDVDGETLTQKECIDKMIENCKTIITKDMDDNFELKEEVLKIWSKCALAMWY